MNSSLVNTPHDNNSGATDIPGLKPLWSALMARDGLGKLQPQAHGGHVVLLDMLGIGVLPGLRFIYEQRPDFNTFQDWVASHYGGTIPPEVIQRCNGLMISAGGCTTDTDVLTPADLEFWHTEGYVVVKNAISKEDCAASRAAIWAFLGMKEDEPESWYKSSNAIEGIMVNLYRDPALDKNRASPVIKRAFEQIWGCTGLVVTTDKIGFNPPETSGYKYRGTGLHWDVSLAPPIPFGVQGILYLTDTAANQGALTVVPGFHRRLETWLAHLPAGRHPRNEDLGAFGPVPIAANAGDFIIWNHALPHSSSPNTAHTPRIVQYMYWYQPREDVHHAWV